MQQRIGHPVIVVTYTVMITSFLSFELLYDCAVLSMEDFARGHHSCFSLDNSMRASDLT